MSNPDPAWRLGDEDDFVLEEDDTFGVGDLEVAELPPFDAPANETAAPALEGEDPFGLTSSAAATAAPIMTPPPAVARDETRITEQPVPRITIHASCDRHEIADIIAGVAADRRLARAEISVESGGIQAAITRFAT